MERPSTKPLILCVLDGWGLGPSDPTNAIAQAKTPHWDALLNTLPCTQLQAHGTCVGLPDHQMGNSEVGHLHLGAGRVCQQALSRINQHMTTHNDLMSPELHRWCDHLSATGKRLHVCGLFSSGGVHASSDHWYRLLDNLHHHHPHCALALHLWTDGRDTLPGQAAQELAALTEHVQHMPRAHVASLCGRYYAMDRDQRWDRTQAALAPLSGGKVAHATSTLMEAWQAAQARGETDEFVQPTRVGPSCSADDGDALLCMNFRADRALQWMQCVTHDPAAPDTTLPDWHGVASLTTYPHCPGIDHVLFPNTLPEHTLGAWLDGLGCTQLRVAETEKFAHVTFFFDGGTHLDLPHATTHLVPSPHVRTYDLAPAMSADAVVDRVVHALEAGEHDVIVVNLANADMVGHTGCWDATLQAVETVDTCLGRLVASTERTGAHLLITADHGNADRMRDANGQPCTTHTCAPVPLVYVGPAQGTWSDAGTLADVAPTVLTLLRLPIPKAMTGRSCFQPMRPS